MSNTGWYENWRARKPLLTGGFARHMRIKDIVHFQHVLWVYQIIPDVSAWRLAPDEAAAVMAFDDLWHQPNATPCWQRDAITNQDLAFLKAMRISMED
jgi:hypothetical protein